MPQKHKAESRAINEGSVSALKLDLGFQFQGFLIVRACGLS